LIFPGFKEEAGRMQTASRDIGFAYPGSSSTALTCCARKSSFGFLSYIFYFHRLSGDWQKAATAVLNIWPPLPVRPIKLHEYILCADDIVVY